jgi:hypothetical protein
MHSDTHSSAVPDRRIDTKPGVHVDSARPRRIEWRFVISTPTPTTPSAAIIIIC